MPQHHHHFLHFLHNRELNELYASIAIKSFAISLIGIFIPIFLIQAGYSLTSVLLFFALLAGTHAIGSIPASKISAKFGFKHSILFSIPILILALLGLYVLDLFGGLFYVVAILFGVSNSLFLIGYHVDFAKFSDKKNRGSEVGFSKVLSLLFNVAGPILGGIILTIFGFKSLFILSSIFLVLSAIPLFYSKDIHNPIKFSFKGIFKGQKIKDTLGFIGFGFERAVGYVLWPIFIFFMILGESYTNLGAVASLTLISSVIIIFAVGKFSDSYKRTILKIGAVLNSIVWFVKTLVSTVLHVFVIDIFSGATQTMINIPFDALSYDKANKDNIVRYIVFREFTINIARSVFLIVMIFVVDITSGFIFGGSLGSLLQLLF